MNVDTGQIRELPEGEMPQPGEVLLDQPTAAYLRTKHPNARLSTLTRMMKKKRKRLAKETRRSQRSR